MYQKLLTLLNSTIALLLTSSRYYYFIRWTILYDESDLIVCVLFEQVFVNVSSDLRNVDTWVPPHHRLPVWSHQKLFKVPLDVVDLQRPPEQPVVGVTKVVSNWRAGVLYGKKHRIIMSETSGLSSERPPPLERSAWVHLDLQHICLVKIIISITGNLVRPLFCGA